MDAVTYDVGDVVPITWLLEVGGTATNGTVSVSVTAPDGTVTTPPVSSASTGHYSTSWTATMTGTYIVRWISTGAVIASDDRTFYVNSNEAGRDYTTLAELKASLSIPTTDSADDDALERAIRAASRAVDKHCKRRFWQATAATARSYDADAWDFLYVDDISTLTGLIVATDDNDDGTAETTWTITTDFVAKPSNNLADDRPVYRLEAVGNRRFPRGRHPGVQVTARWGWPVVPDEVRDATLLKAAKLFRRKDSPDGVAGSNDFGVIRISQRDDPDVVMLLADFRRARALVG